MQVSNNYTVRYIINYNDGHKVDVRSGDKNHIEHVSLKNCHRKIVAVECVKEKNSSSWPKSAL